MKLDETNVFPFLDRTLENFDEIREAREALGFRLNSLSISSPLSDSTALDQLRYSGVMIKETKLWESQTFTHLSAEAFDQTLKDMTGQEFGAYLISATGPVGKQVYAAVFRKSGRFPIVDKNMTAEAFAARNIEQKDKKRILISADAFGSSLTPHINPTHYCAIWDNNTDRIAWNADALELKGDERQQMFDAMIDAGARPAIHALTPAGGRMTIYVDSRTGKWRSHHFLSRVEMHNKIKTEKEAKRLLVGVTAWGTGDSARFSGIWDSVNTTQARRFRRDGETISPFVKLHPIDEAMRTFLDVQNLRGAAVAVVHESKLVFARGYSFAEASYPAITAETLFRQASVSKTFTAMAVWRLIQRGDLDLTSTLLDVLPIKQRNGKAPVDDRFKNITVRDLLESKSGIDQLSSGKALEEYRKSSATQPASAKFIESWIAEHKLLGKPGEVSSTSYGKTDYFLLGQIVAKVAGTANFFAALKTLVLDPLEMTRTRPLRSRREDQANNEAPYHLAAHTRDTDGKIESLHLKVSPSMVHDDRRLVPHQYGGSNLDILVAPGGLSSSVIDVARLCALLSLRDPNQPVLSPDRLDEMFDKAETATKDAKKFEDDTKIEISNHGYHGFDNLTIKAKNADGTVTSFTTEKGGELSGVRTKYKTTDGKTWYIIAYNGDPGDLSNKDWYSAVKAAAKGEDWSEGDKFPSFGMSSIAVDEFV